MNFTFVLWNKGDRDNPLCCMIEVKEGSLDNKGKLFHWFVSSFLKTITLNVEEFRIKNSHNANDKYNDHVVLFFH